MQFLHISQGALSDLDTLIELARSLRYLTQETLHIIDFHMIQIDKMITGLIKNLQGKVTKA